MSTMSSSKKKVAVQQPTVKKESSSAPAARPGVDTVVLYVFGGLDPYYQGNLLYFIRHGILPNVDYVIVLQDGWEKVQEATQEDLKKLPPNVQVITHPNECFDWGTYGWYLKSHLQEFRKNYKYIIFMNSSIRGPFYVSYEDSDWVTIMKQQLHKQKDVKLFGATINCELYHYEAAPEEQWRYNPHVQSFLLIMDFDTLDILFQDPYIFQCHTELADAIHYSEIGSSLAILKAGYNIASMQLRYQGIDWRKKENWKCNGNKNPSYLYHYDSLTIPPLEMMFVKVKLGFHRTKVVPVRLSVWQELLNQDVLDPTKNKGLEEQNQLMGEIELDFKAKYSCFDPIFYQLQNPDLIDSGIFQPKQLWEHFLSKGYIQGRKYRFTC